MLERASHVPPGRSTLTRYLRWAAGLVLVGLSYPVQRVPLYRRNQRPDPEAEPPAPDRELPGDPDTVQRSTDGVGPLFHRHYHLTLADTELSPEELIAAIAGEPQRVAPRALASFETFDGDTVDRLEVGDELLVRLPGPWDGPVRVIERTPTSFRFVTLRGHMEAGEIEFRAGIESRGFLRFEIESWARSASRVFAWLYETVPVGREMQLHMWSQFCANAARIAGGVRMSNVVSTTRTIETP
jgi:hypothetical protein